MNRFPTDQRTIVAATLLSLALSSAIPYRALGGEHVDTTGGAQAPEVKISANAVACTDFLVDAIIDGKTGFSPEGFPLILDDKTEVTGTIEGHVDPITVELWLPQDPRTTTARGYVRLIRVGEGTAMYPFDFTANFPAIDGLVQLLPGGLILVRETGSLESTSDQFIILDPLAKLMSGDSATDSPMPVLFKTDGSELEFKSATIVAGQEIYNFSYSDVSGNLSTLIMTTRPKYGAGHTTALVSTQIIPGYEEMEPHGTVLVGTKESIKTEETVVPAQSPRSLADVIIRMFGQEKVQVSKKEIRVLESIAIVDLLDPSGPHRTLNLVRNSSKDPLTGMPEIEVYRSDDKNILTLALKYGEQVRWIQLDMADAASKSIDNAKVLNDRLLSNQMTDGASVFSPKFRSYFGNRFVVDLFEGVALGRESAYRVRVTDLRTGHNYVQKVAGPVLNTTIAARGTEWNVSLAPDVMSIANENDSYYLKLSAKSSLTDANKIAIQHSERMSAGRFSELRKLVDGKTELKEVTAILKAAKNSGR